MNKIAIVINGLLIKKDDSILGTYVDVQFVTFFENNKYIVSLVGLNDKHGSYIISHKYSNNVFNNIITNVSGNTIWSKLLNYLKILYSFKKQAPTFACVYIFFPGTLGLLIALYCNLANIKYGLYIRGDIERKTIILSLLYKYCIKNANFIFCTGTYLTSLYKKINHSTQMVAPMIKIKNDKAISRSDKAKIQFLYFGRIEKEKGIEELVDACINLKKKNLVFKLLLIGPNEMNNQLNLTIKEKIESNQLKQDLVIGKYLSDENEIRKVFTESDVFIFPTYHEGFPRVIFEAMFFSLPIITTNIPTIEHFIQPTKNNWLVPTMKVQELQEAMYDAIINYEKRKKFGEENFAYVNNIFSQFKNVSHASQVLEVIKE